jgi:hypothetical protein
VTLDLIFLRLCLYEYEKGISTRIEKMHRQLLHYIYKFHTKNNTAVAIIGDFVVDFEAIFSIALTRVSEA